MILINKDQEHSPLLDTCSLSTSSDIFQMFG